jgi:hypothetical protein
MRDQYAGDISDMIKFSLLRALAGDDRTLGVAWYYHPENDGTDDGKHRLYLTEEKEKWSSLDAQVFESLRPMKSGERSVAALETLPIWPQGVRFHRVPVPNRLRRADWVKDMADHLSGCGLVFLDPDIGVGTSDRHATPFEIAELLRTKKRTLALIKFPGRVKHDEQIAGYHEELLAVKGVEGLITLRTPVMRTRWFTLLNPDAALKDRLRDFCERLQDIGVKASLSS